MLAQAEMESGDWQAADKVRHYGACHEKRKNCSEKWKLFLRSCPGSAYRSSRPVESITGGASESCG